MIFRFSIQIVLSRNLDLKASVVEVRDTLWGRLEIDQDGDFAVLASITFCNASGIH